MILAPEDRNAGTPSYSRFKKTGPRSDEMISVLCSCAAKTKLTWESSSPIRMPHIIPQKFRQLIRYGETAAARTWTCLYQFVQGRDVVSRVNKDGVNLFTPSPGPIRITTKVRY